MPEFLAMLLSPAEEVSILGEGSHCFLHIAGVPLERQARGLGIAAANGVDDVAPEGHGNFRPVCPIGEAEAMAAVAVAQADEDFRCHRLIGDSDVVIKELVG